jgi:hypothetical protein
MTFVAILAALSLFATGLVLTSRSGIVPCSPRRRGAGRRDCGC